METDSASAIDSVDAPGDAGQTQSGTAAGKRRGGYECSQSWLARNLSCHRERGHEDCKEEACSDYQELALLSLDHSTSLLSLYFLLNGVLARWKAFLDERVNCLSFCSKCSGRRFPPLRLVHFFPLELHLPSAPSLTLSPHSCVCRADPVNGEANACL